jgi:hypothetical protein
MSAQVSLAKSFAVGAESMRKKDIVCPTVTDREIFANHVVSGGTEPAVTLDATWQERIRKNSLGLC